MEKISGILSGVAGVHYAAAELSRKGFIASITLRNTKGIDVLASDDNGKYQFGIQVKTNQSDRKAWLLNEKAENYYGNNLFYIFVNMKKENERPDFYVVPSKIVAQYVEKEHKIWKNTPGKNGQKHNDTTLRMFKDYEDKYLEKWELIQDKVNS